ncbi:aldo/keto reductase [Methylobacterium sp. 77]|uniref:aldo/keto reductase n=1 Tax=Methylobacterium sp. 77 TaxID=1101192 RepID=UPI0005650C2F|nr:aldo/keto reductase [Methylobacterium sp. 77]
MGLGTETDETESFAILDAFFEAGGNGIDTADVYGKGASEELLGRWRASRPSDVTDRAVTLTKGRFGTGPDVNDVGTSRRHLHRSLETSLRRLKVETIDLYQLHGWDPLTPVEETIAFLDAATRAGKIHHVGLSNFTGWQMQLFLSTAKGMGAPVPVTLQQQYSLIYREIEYEVIPAALHNAVGLLPWSPLAAGFLSGKYVRGGASSDGRLAADNPMVQHQAKQLHDNDAKWATLDAVRQAAERIGATPSQVALAWVMAQASVTAPIIGARTMEQLRDNLVAANLVLDADVTETLSQVSAPRPEDYPYGRFGALQRERYIDSSEQALREL